MSEISLPYTKEMQTGEKKEKKKSMFGRKPSNGSFGKKHYNWNNRKTSIKAKRNDIIDGDYSKWLGTQPCVITGRVAERGVGAYNMHCHHIHGRVPGRNDYMQVPIIGYVHSWGDKSYHSNTKKDFCDKNNILTDDIVEYFEEVAKMFVKKYKENGGKIKQNN